MEELLGPVPSVPTFLVCPDFRRLPQRKIKADAQFGVNSLPGFLSSHAHTSHAQG